MTELISSFEAALKRFENAVGSITTTSRKLNENQNTAIHRAAARRYEERNPRSRIGNTDILSSWDAGMRKLEMRDKLKEFNFATRMSGFGRYVDKESEVVDSIENKNELLDAGNRNRARMRSERNYRFWYDNADEFDQKIHDLTMRYHGDKKSADQTYRKMLQKEFPIFFKSSKMSTKDMHKMATGMRNMRNVPLVGGAIGIMSNPISGSIISALGAYKIIDNFFEAQNAYNKSISSWNRSQRTVSDFDFKNYEKFFRLAGYESKDDIYRAIGSMYGTGMTPEMVFRIAYQAKEMNPIARKMYLDSVGIDEGIYNAALFRYGETPSKAEIINARANELEDEKKEAGSSGGNFWRWLELALFKNFEARTNKSFSNAAFEGLGTVGIGGSASLGLLLYNPSDTTKAIDEANSAAASLDNYQRNGGDYSVGAYGSSGDKTTTKIYQLNGDIITDADNIKKLAADAEGKTEIIDRYEESVSADTKRSR